MLERKISNDMRRFKIEEYSISDKHNFKYTITCVYELTDEHVESEKDSYSLVQMMKYMLEHFYCFFISDKNQTGDVISFMSEVFNANEKYDLALGVGKNIMIPIDDAPFFKYVLHIGDTIFFTDALEGDATVIYCYIDGFLYSKRNTDLLKHNVLTAYEYNHDMNSVATSNNLTHLLYCTHSNTLKESIKTLKRSCFYGKEIEARRRR